MSVPQMHEHLITMKFIDIKKKTERNRSVQCGLMRFSKQCITSEANYSHAAIKREIQPHIEYQTYYIDASLCLIYNLDACVVTAHLQISLY